MLAVHVQVGLRVWPFIQEKATNCGTTAADVPDNFFWPTNTMRIHLICLCICNYYVNNIVTSLDLVGGWKIVANYQKVHLSPFGHNLKG